MCRGAAKYTGAKCGLEYTASSSSISVLSLQVPLQWCCCHPGALSSTAEATLSSSAAKEVLHDRNIFEGILSLVLLFHRMKISEGMTGFARQGFICKKI